MNGHAFKKYSNLKDTILIMFVTGDFIVTPISCLLSTIFNLRMEQPAIQI